MLTKKTTFGVGAMFAANVIGRIAALVAQVITGWVLTDLDFGVFAVATTCANMAGLLRGGDIQIYLVSLPPKRRRFRTGSVFWISEGFYLLGVVPMVAAAPWIAEYFQSPDLVPLLWILGITSLLNPARLVLRSRLNAELRFGTAAAGGLLATLIQYPTLIVLTLVWASPLALAIPVLIGSVAEIIYLAIRSRPSLDDFRFNGRLATGVFRRLLWLLAIAGTTSLWMNGDYLVAQFLVPIEVLGIYFFGYQLSVQPGRLFNVAVNSVLVPVMRRVLHDPARVRQVLLRVVGIGGFVVAAANVGLLACIASLQELIWQGKWASAEFPVQVLSIALIYTTILGMVSSPFLAARRFREALVANSIRAFGVCSGAALGAIAGGTVQSLAGWIGGMMIVSSLASIWWLAHRLGASGGRVLLHAARCTVPLVVFGTIAAVLGEMVLGPRDDRATAALGLLVSGSGFTVGTLLATRMLPQEMLNEVLRLLPRGLGDRRVVRRLLGAQSTPQER